MGVDFHIWLYKTKEFIRRLDENKYWPEFVLGLVVGLVIGWII